MQRESNNAVPHYTDSQDDAHAVDAEIVKLIENYSNCFTNCHHFPKSTQNLFMPGNKDAKGSLWEHKWKKKIVGGGGGGGCWDKISLSVRNF